MRQYRFQAPREPLSTGRSVTGPVRTRSARSLAGLALAGLLMAGLLMGCAPPAVVIASQAMDGVSYLTTGKSTTDHLLSTALDEDCALHRVISGVAVCQDDQHKPVQTASLADTPVIGDDAAEAGDGDTMPVQQASAPVEQAVAGHGAPRGPGLGADMFFVPYHAGDAPAAESHAENTPTAAPTAAPDDGAAHPALPPIPDAAVPNATAVETPIAVPTPATETETASPAVPRYFIVLGSFAHKAYAERAARGVADADGARVVEVKLSGRTFYRVVAGPFDRHGTLAARRRYAGAGYGSAWPAPACDGDTVRPGCIATR